MSCTLVIHQSHKHRRIAWAQLQMSRLQSYNKGCVRRCCFRHFSEKRWGRKSLPQKHSRLCNYICFNAFHRPPQKCQNTTCSEHVNPFFHYVTSLHLAHNSSCQKATNKMRRRRLKKIRREMSTSLQRSRGGGGRGRGFGGGT